MKRIFGCFIISVFLFAGTASAELKGGHGWSVNPDHELALEEAVSMMEKKVKAPFMIHVYFTEEFDGQKIADTLNSRFSDAKVFGFQIFRGVFSPDGVHIGKNGSVGIFGLEGKGYTVGVAAAEFEKDKFSQKEIEGLIAATAENAGKTIKDIPALISMGTEHYTAIPMIDGLMSVFPKETRLVGGTAVNNAFEPGQVIGNSRSFKTGVALAFVYTDKKIGNSFFAGYSGKKKSGIITKGGGNIISEIDGKPAQQVFREWAEGYYDNIDVSKGDQIVMSSVINPLAKAFKMPDGSLKYITIHAFKFHQNGKDMTVALTVNEGERIYYVEGSRSSLIRRAGRVVKNALKNGKIKVREICGGVHYYCCGAAAGINFDDGALKMSKEIKKVMRDKSWIGAFTGGEQGNIVGLGMFEGNLMSTMAIFAK
ncbi:FIST N-terminal domain-containing protein [Desulfobacterales bacterium HSG2]|nr:FIST N-terminal domain-containing protein [Desulfobacterales bacterium HSG2]